MLSDYIKFSFDSLRHRKLRSWLTMIGIFIGIAAVVALISISQGMQTTITEQFEMMGTNKIMVMPGGGAMFGMFGGGELNADDLDAVGKAEGVDIAAEMYYESGNIKFSDETKNTFIIGLPTDETLEIIENMQGFDIEKGRDLKSGDRYKITIGWLLWEGDFFEKSVDLRDKIEIEGQEFSVVGLVSRIGNNADDSQVYIPLETAREILDEPKEISTIFVEIKESYEVDDVAENIKEELRDSRDEDEGEETFSVQTFEQLLEQFNDILGIVSIVLIGIAAISIVVGGVGIMNTMYTSVLERTKEIGIMKAVGAKNSNVMTLFLIESGMIGLAGGIIGIGIGIGLSKIVEIIAAQAGLLPIKAYLGAPLLLGALAFSFIIGAASGTLPAMQASKMKPVDALRYE